MEHRTIVRRPDVPGEACESIEDPDNPLSVIKGEDISRYDNVNVIANFLGPGDIRLRKDPTDNGPHLQRG